MDEDDWLAERMARVEMDGEDVEAEREDYSFEDSEQFEDDSICSVVTSGGEDSGGGRSGAQTWRGWDDGCSSTSAAGTSSAAAAAATTGRFELSPRTRRQSGGRHSAASTMTLTLSRAAAASTSALPLSSSTNGPSTLFTAAARACARHLPFTALEHSYNHAMLYRYTFPAGEGEEMMRMVPKGPHVIPDKIFLAITWWCFPESEDDIRLYSCLANGGVDEFYKGEQLYAAGMVNKAMQIGYHLSAVVTSSPLSFSQPYSRRETNDQLDMSGAMRRVAAGGVTTSEDVKTYSVSLRVDRCRVVWCECSCSVRAWCSHMVALCLYRLHQPQKVEFRVTIWDSINELGNTQLKKFAQYLVNDLPRQYLPLAQRLLDSLRDPTSSIFHSKGAPDPTDGVHEAVALWSVEQQQLHESISKTLYRFCQPSPTVHCDVQFLSSTQPAIASEWQLLLRPFKSRGPEGLWNLMSIVRAMFKRRDENATTLLHVITDELLASTQILLWWLVSSLQQSARWTQNSDRKSNPLLSNYEHTQLCAAALCDEMVALWRVAALNPALREEERRQLAAYLQLYHRAAVDRLWNVLEGSVVPQEHGGGTTNRRNGSNSGETQHSNLVSLLCNSTVNEHRQPLSPSTARFSPDLFPAFYPALQACHVPTEACLFSSLHSSAWSFPFSESNSSPHLPQWKGGLRKPYTISNVCASTYYYGYGMLNPGGMDKKKKKKKRRKSKRSTTLTAGSGTPRRSGRREDRRQGEMDARFEGVESAESGQESDMPGPSNSGGAVRIGGGAPRRGSSFPSEDVDLVFASAHQSLEGVDLKLARCEALASHGYTDLALTKAAEVVIAMRATLPNLIWTMAKTRSRDASADPSLPSCSSSTVAPSGGWPLSTSSSSSLASSTGATNNANRQQASGSRWQASSSSQSVYQRQPKTGAGVQRGGVSRRVIAIPDNAMPPPALPSIPDPQLHAVSELACRTVERALLVTKMLQCSPAHRQLVFSLLLQVLALPKAAMSTKHLQVRLYHLESEVLSALSSLPLGKAELEAIRAQAAMVSRWEDRDGVRMEDSGVPPVPLASFIFDALVNRAGDLSRTDDESLAVSACLAVLGARHAYSDTEFPMLGECLRRQRGELAMALFRRYKECGQKLGLVLDRILDSSLHRMYRGYHKSNANYFLEQYQSTVARGERPSFPVSSGQARTNQEKARGEENVEEDEEGKAAEAGSSGSRRSSIQQLSVGERASVASWDSADNKSVDEGEEGADNGGSDGLSISTRRSSDEGNESSSNSLPPLTSGRVGACMGGETRINKRSRVSQPCEAHAHYMFELAKRLLVEAGGDQTTVVFSAAVPVLPQNNNNHVGPHRKLLMCSFLTGLYALGLSNAASKSWASRTYSTHVSWVHAQAIDIGAPALEVVRETWTAHLTPPEAAALADKASQSRDAATVSAGALLALSVLSSSHALSVNEGTRALLQCREHGVRTLEQAVVVVEDVSGAQEVYPDILFTAARYWAEIALDTDPPPSQPLAYHPAQMAAHPMAPQQQSMPPPTWMQGGTTFYGSNRTGHMAPSAPPQHHPHMVQQQQQHYMQQQHYGQMQSTLPQPYPPSLFAMHQYRPHADDERSEGAGSSASSTSGGGLPPHQQPPRSGPIPSPMHTSHSAPNLGPSPSALLLPPQLQQQQQMQQSSRQPPMPSYDPRLERLTRAFKLGLRAMEVAASRSVDAVDKSVAKYHQNPPFADDIRWMFSLACRMNTQWTVLSFCDVASKTISSPFILNEFISKVGPYFRNMSQGRQLGMQRTPYGHGQGKFRAAALAAGTPPPIAELFDRCIEMVYAAITARMGQSRMTPSDNDEVFELMKMAIDRLHTLPESGFGLLQELYMYLRKQKHYKKELQRKVDMLFQECYANWRTPMMFNQHPHDDCR